jgi:hypothetical protein
MKGLPFKANVDDVLKFYNGFTLATGSVYLKRHADGRLNGEVRASGGGVAPAASRRAFPAPRGAWAPQPGPAPL